MYDDNYFEVMDRIDRVRAQRREDTWRRLRSVTETSCTKKQLETALLQLHAMPFAQLMVEPWEAATGMLEVTTKDWEVMDLTYREYMAELTRNRPWCGPFGAEAYFRDETYEFLSERYYLTKMVIMHHVKLWESSHKGTVRYKKARW